MLERLRNLLTGMMVTQQLQLLFDAIEVLLSNGVFDLEFAINQELSQPDIAPGEIYERLVDRCLMPAFRTHLTAMGIEVADDIPLAVCVDLFSTVMLVDNFEDKVVINGLARCEEESEDVLAEILAVVSAKPAEYFIPYLESVTDALIARIANITDGYDVPIPVDPADYARAKARVQMLMNFARQHLSDVLSQPIYLDRVKLGGNADVMLSGLRDTVETIPPRAAAFLIILFTMASDSLDSSIVNAVKREIELTFEDLVQAMSVGKLATQLLKQVGYE